MAKTKQGAQKRAGQPAVSEPPHKKTKLSPDPDSEVEDMGSANSAPTKAQDAMIAAESTNSPTPPSVSVSKKSRKRAADFLSDYEDDTPEITSSKSKPGEINEDRIAAKKARRERKRDKKRKAKHEARSLAELSLTADGINGVIEKKGDPVTQTKTSKKVGAQSMLVEAQRTLDHEIDDEWGGLSSDKTAKPQDGLKETLVEEDDLDDDEEDGVALLAAIDSDVEEEDDMNDQGWEDAAEAQKIPLGKAGRKHLKSIKNKSTPDDEPGTMYIGRLPHGFYEDELRNYFGQFGDITKLRLSRNKRTGASKHFAFIEFSTAEVAEIAAKTMDAYLLFGHILKCKLVSKEQLEKMGDSLWKGANKKFRKLPHAKIERERLAAPKSVDQWRQKNEREQEKRDKRAKKLKDVLGYELNEVQLKDPEVALEQAKLSGKDDEEDVDAPVAAIEDSKKSVPAVNGQEHHSDSADAVDKPSTAAVDVSEETAAPPNGTKDETNDKSNPSQHDETPISPQQKKKQTSKEKNALKRAKKSASASVPATNPDGTQVKKEKYIVPTHKKLQDKAQFARDHPEEHRSLKLEKKKAEKVAKDEKNAKKEKRRFENREERRARKGKKGEGSEGGVGDGEGEGEGKRVGKKVSFEE